MNQATLDKVLVDHQLWLIGKGGLMDEESWRDWWTGVFEDEGTEFWALVPYCECDNCWWIGPEGDLELTWVASRRYNSETGQTHPNGYKEVDCCPVCKSPEIKPSTWSAFIEALKSGA